MPLVFKFRNRLPAIQNRLYCICLGAELLISSAVQSVNTQETQKKYVSSPETEKVSMKIIIVLNIKIHYFRISELHIMFQIYPVKTYTEEKLN